MRKFHSPRRTGRHLALWAGLLAYLLTATLAHGENVLCVQADGTVRVESGFNGVCGSVVLAERCDADAAPAIAADDAECHACDDTPLPRDGGRDTTKPSSQPFFAAVCPAAPALNASICVSPQAVFVQNSASHILLLVRTTILLI